VWIGFLQHFYLVCIDLFKCVRAFLLEHIWHLVVTHLMYTDLFRCKLGSFNISFGVHRSLLMYMRLVFWTIWRLFVTNLTYTGLFWFKLGSFNISFGVHRSLVMYMGLVFNISGVFLWHISCILLYSFDVNCVLLTSIFEFSFKPSLKVSFTVSLDVSSDVYWSLCTYLSSRCETHDEYRSLWTSSDEYRSLLMNTGLSLMNIDLFWYRFVNAGLFWWIQDSFG